MTMKTDLNELQQFQVAELPVEDQGAFSQQVFERFKRPGVFLVT
jgi:hypothetical protein